MYKTFNWLKIALINIILTLTFSELLFVGYYYIKDGEYISVPEKLAAEKSSFEVEKQKSTTCSDRNNVLAPHPYLAFVHTSRPECHSLANNTGHRGPNVPLIKNPNDYAVMIMGGSVANQIFQFKKQDIHSFFHKKMPKKNIIILNGSLEGWKQPQQLFMLQMYGETLDAVISIEGFNEMIFNRRMDYRLRPDAPFLPGYRKANSVFLTHQEQGIIWINNSLFSLVNNNFLLRHSKTAYFISEHIRSFLEQKINQKDGMNLLQEGSLQDIENIFVLPKDWPVEKRRAYTIEQYKKYLALMQATARQYSLHLAIFLQPAPAIHKHLTAEELKVVDNLDYKNDYLLFEKELLKSNKSIPVYSLLDVFSSEKETIYRDGIHYRRESPGATLVTKRVLNTLDAQWKFK